MLLIITIIVYKNIWLKNINRYDFIMMIKLNSEKKEKEFWYCSTSILFQ